MYALRPAARVYLHGRYRLPNALERKKAADGAKVWVLIADARPTLRRGLRALLTLLPQVEVIGEAADGRESVDLLIEGGST